MKSSRHIVLAISLLFFSQAFAEGPLAEIMKTMGQRVQVVKKQVLDTSLNTSSAAISVELQKLAKSCHEFLPPKVQLLPEGQEKDQKIALYKQMIETLEKYFGELETDFVQNDNVKASNDLQKILTHMKEGHVLFK